MTLKKILAALLCAAAVLSVMTVMAFATQGMRGAGAYNDPPPPSNDTTTTTKAPTQSTTRWNPADSWNKLKGNYNSWILFWQKILLFGLKLLQLITNNFAFLRR